MTNKKTTFPKEIKLWATIDLEAPGTMSVFTSRAEARSYKAKSEQVKRVLVKILP